MVPTIFRFTIPVLLVFCLLPGISDAGEKQDPFADKITSWERTINRISARIKTGRAGTIEKRELQSQLQALANDATKERDDAQKQAGQVKELLAALGEEPKKGKESGEIGKRRNTLKTKFSKQESRAKQASLFIARSEQLIGEINKQSRQRLKTLLFERGVTPVSYTAWTIALPEAGHLVQASLVDAWKDWWANARATSRQQVALTRNLAIALLATIAGWVFGGWLRRRYGRVQKIKKPSYARRLFAGLVEGGGRTLGPIVFIVFLSISILDSDFITGPLTTVVWAVSRNLVLFLFGYALINAVLTPRRQQWRILGFDADASRLLVIRLKLTLAVFLIFEAVYRSVSWATMSAELEAVSSLVFTIVMVPLLISLLDNRVWNWVAADGAEEPARPRIRIPRSRAILTLSFLLLPVMAATGYAVLASYLVKSVVMTGLVVAGLWFVRNAGREGLSVALDRRFRFGQSFQTTFSLDEASTAKVVFWLRVGLDLSLFVVVGLALLPVWGFSAEETALSATKLMRGVHIGSYTLSLVDILIALLLFVAIISLTRILQRGMGRHLLPNLSKDKGVRDAMKTGVGYVGFVIAGLVGFSALGLNLTNLAVVAGALSVGIGFGLQNVVNNFVSGLILLVERPIKPGDWVVIGSNEGTVKKVNVRSTEIETFQRASVIIPNADLIANPVTNWTHKNILGRIEIRVGVAYGSDPRLVEEILLENVKGHPNIIADPEPNVLFMDFGDNALIFELRAYLADVQQRLRTASDIRFAINDALKAKGIEIPNQPAMKTAKLPSNAKKPISRPRNLWRFLLSIWLN